MKKTILVIVAALVALLLGACTSTTPTSSAPSQTSSASEQETVPPVVKETPTPTPTPTASKSVRGNTVKKIGDPSFWRESEDGPEFGRFYIRKIAPITCTQQFSSKPKNGRFIALTVDVITSASLAKESNPTVYLSPADFEYIAPNGTTFNGSLGTFEAFSCIDESLRLKSDFGPAEKAHGIIVLDVPSKGGILVTGKVEWNLP